MVFIETTRQRWSSVLTEGLNLTLKSKINDHVIDDWSDGKRCIGLSNAEMLKRYRNILRRKYREDSK